MNSTRHYIDYNASAPLRSGARAAMMAALERCGNPSSVHAEGRAARTLVEDARQQVAQLCGAAREGVVFTSGATEALAMALRPVWSVNGKVTIFDRLIVGATEHACVLHGHGFAPDKVRIAPVDCAGRIDVAELEALLNHAGRSLVAIQLANNETGVLQEMAGLAALVRQAGGVLVCDGVQGAGRLDISALGVDGLVLSAHKLGGPKGVGALIMYPAATMPEALLRGGGQERRARGGTENVAGIAGFGAAAKEARAKLASARDPALRDGLERALIEIAPEVVIFGRDTPRLPNTSAFAFPALSAETALMALDLGGVALSSGSACSSGKVGASHVLEAMKVPPALAKCALRASFGFASTEADRDALLAELHHLLQRKGAIAA